MTWLLDLIPGGGFTALAGVLLAILGALGFVSRKATVAERNRMLAKEAKARDENLKRIKNAAAARPAGSVLDDPRNRDR